MSSKMVERTSSAVRAATRDTFPAPPRGQESASVAPAPPSVPAANARTITIKGLFTTAPCRRCPPQAALHRREHRSHPDLGREAHHLHDLGHCACARASPLDVHDDVDRARDLLAHRYMWQRHVGHQRQRLDPPQRVRGGVRVHGRHRSVVAAVQRLQHVERLGPAHLPDDDPVRAHAQGVAHELADRHLAARPRGSAGGSPAAARGAGCRRSSAASSIVITRSPRR